MTQRGTVQYKLIGALVALAAALTSSLAKAEQWCPGQPWSLEWGANLDYEACHETPLPNDTDLDHLGPIDWGATPVTGDGNHVDMSGVSTGNAGSSGGNQAGGGASPNANGTTTGTAGGNQAGSANGGSPRT